MVREITVDPVKLYHMFKDTEKRFTFCTFKDYLKLKGYVNPDLIIKKSEMKVKSLKVKQTK